MKKVLLIDESPLLRRYIGDKLKANGIEVIPAINGLDGMIKLRKTYPDLVIMDYYLTRKSINEILKEKLKDPNISGIPIVILSSGIQKQNLAMLAKYNIIKILSKPIKIDLFFKTISSVLNIRIALDSTPCIVETHVNEKILFIEIAGGLNRDKIELLQFKISEQLELYKIAKPGILFIMSDISRANVTDEKFTFLISLVMELTRTPLTAIKILSSSAVVRELVANSLQFNKLQITQTLEMALKYLTGLNVADFLDEGKSIIKEDFISNKKRLAPEKENLQLRFQRETNLLNYNSIKKDIIIAIVDDDENIHDLVTTAFTGSNWIIKDYYNGRTFIGDIRHYEFDIVFLDLMMPEMNGFGVLEYMNEYNIDLPVIILSALSQIETIEKAISYGIKSYMTKPLQLDIIMRKTAGLLKKNF